MRWMNKLCYGDCLTVMQGMPSGSVDLIYLDPPFNSQRNYKAIYRTETGRPLPDQVEAFCDTWTLDSDTEQDIRDMPVLFREAGIDDAVAEFWRHWTTALRSTHPSLLAYLTYMVRRLLPMHRLLKPTGSVYLHCDPKASHYLKVAMDGIFGHGNFLNEVVWAYRTGGASKRWFGRKHDILLYYARSMGRHTFHVDKERSYSTGAPPGFKGIQKHQDEHGRWYTMASLRDVWEINAVGRTSKERLGYATQKPVALLERIIRASSNEGDVVFDPFCGCATTVEAAHRLRRKWIGIDIAIHAVKRVAAVRLRDRLGLTEGKDFVVEGVPRNLEGVRDLWNRDRFHFRKWAVEQADGFVTAKRSADRGIDGRVYFDVPGEAQLQSMVLEVKGGANVGINVVRDLRGVLERDSARMAGLILMEEPGERKAANFRREMAEAGDLEVLGVRYPRMQMLTVREILGGGRFRTPSVARGRGEGRPVLPLG